MRVKMQFDLDEIDRRAIAAHFGVEGLASRGDCRATITSAVVGMLRDYREGLEAAAEASPDEPLEVHSQDEMPD